MGILNFIFITLIILWVIRIAFRLLLPLVLKRLIKKMQNRAGHAQANQAPPRKEGTINVDYVPPATKATKAEKAGEFVDFEEIK